MLIISIYLPELQPFQSHCARPVFGLWRAPVFPTPASEDGIKVAQGHDKGGHLTTSPKSLVHPLHQALLSAQDAIQKLTCENVSLREENVRLTLNELGIAEALEELTSLYTQAKKEKEEMEARRNKMEEDFKKEKKIWQDLSRGQLGEIRHFRIKLLVAQSLRDHMEEEVREYKRELHEGRKQVEREITSLEESLRVQREENAARLSAMEDHRREVIRVREENAATKLRESDEKWQRRVSQLEEEIKEKRSVVSSLIDNVTAATGELRNTMILFNWNRSELCQGEKKWESKCEALEESYRKALTEKEESWQRRVQEMERRNELEKMWLQKEKEWREKTSALEEEIKCLTKDTQQLQVNCLRCTIQHIKYFSLMSHPESDKKILVKCPHWVQIYYYSVLLQLTKHKDRMQRK